jgi:hypothetical protein
MTAKFNAARAEKPGNISSDCRLPMEAIHSGRRPAINFVAGA